MLIKSSLLPISHQRKPFAPDKNQLVIVFNFSFVVYFSLFSASFWNEATKTMNAGGMVTYGKKHGRFFSVFLQLV